MTNLRRYLAPLATALAVAWSSAALAFNPQPDPPGFGLVGMVPGQVAQIHAVCSNLPSQIPPGPCHVQLAFLDASGKTLKRTTLSLKPGRAASFEFAASTDGRTPVQPIVLLDQGSGLVIPTVEIVDSNTGRTTLFVTPVNFLPAVQK